VNPSALSETRNNGLLLAIFMIPRAWGSVSLHSL